MIVLGVLLLIAVAVVTVFVVMSGAGQQTRLTSDMLNLDWRPSVLLVFLLGALCLLVAVVALSMIQRGTRRRVEQRRELKRLRNAERDRDSDRSPTGHEGRSTSGTSERVVDVRGDDARKAGSKPETEARRPTSPDDPATDVRSSTAHRTWHDDPDAGRGSTRAY